MSDIEWIFYHPHPGGGKHNGASIITAYPYTWPIDQLWNQVKHENPHLDAYVGKAPCKFYIPSNLSVAPSNTLLSRCQEWLRQHRVDGGWVTNIDLVNNIFPDWPPPGLVHIIVATEEILEGLDYLGDLNDLALRQRERDIESFRRSFPSPSSGISTSLQDVIIEHADKFHTGRPAANFGPPVSLFNHALGRFDYRLSHLNDEPFTPDASPAGIQLAYMFMDIAADRYRDENTRVALMKEFIERSWGVSLNWEVQQTSFGIRPDAIYPDKEPFVVVEVKNEAGLEGDASMRAALSYARIVTSKEYPRKPSNFPAVLYGIMGNLLEIGVATYTDGAYYNLLFSERLHLGFYAAKNVVRLARAFAATRRVISDLKEFYTRLQTTPPAQRSIAHLFPSPLPVPTYTDDVPSLTFTRRLSRSGKTFVLAENETTRQSGIYLATMPRPRSADGDTEMSSSVDALADTVEVVVKFTAQYHPDAHRLLATKGFAPVLHACVPVCGGLFMVVMDLVHGEMAWDIGNRGGLLSHGIYKDIRDAITLLHSNGLVFGDLRTPNIMVVSSGSGSDDHHRGMLVDFDWVGTHGIGRYPATLNIGLPEWDSTGIQPYGLMDKTHDLAMLDKFKDRCQLV